MKYSMPSYTELPSYRAQKIKVDFTQRHEKDEKKKLSEKIHTKKKYNKSLLSFGGNRVVR